LTNLGTMDGRAIPDHQQLACDVPEEVLKEAHHVGAAPGVLAHLEQDTASGRDPTDQGQVVARQRHA
jgi:hypothetical protein